VLRNNGDGSSRRFIRSRSLRRSAICLGRSRNDGNPDASFLDADGHLIVFHNERSGNFGRSRTASLGVVKALAAAIRVAAAGSICWWFAGRGILRLTRDGESWRKRRLRGANAATA